LMPPEDAVEPAGVEAAGAAPPGVGEPDWDSAESVTTTANIAVAMNVRFIELV
jgi:hypothetical protein